MTQSPHNLLKYLNGKLRPVQIRSRLLATFVAPKLASAISMGVVSIVAGIPSGCKQVIDQLESAATLNETWLNI